MIFAIIKQKQIDPQMARDLQTIWDMELVELQFKETSS